MVTLPEGKPPMPKHWKHLCFPQNLSVYCPSVPHLSYTATTHIMDFDRIYCVYIYKIIYILVLKPLGFRGTHFFSNFREFCELTIIDKRVSPNGCLLRFAWCSLYRPHLDPIRGSQEVTNSLFHGSPPHFPKLT